MTYSVVLSFCHSATSHLLRIQSNLSASLAAVLSELGRSQDAKSELEHASQLEVEYQMHMRALNDYVFAKIESDNAEYQRRESRRLWIGWSQCIACLVWDIFIALSMPTMQNMFGNFVGAEV